MFIAGIITVFITFLIIFLYSIMPANSKQVERDKFFGRNYAHRGLHTRAQDIPENSLPAFEAAAAAGYGIELDIQLTADKHVVVFHDDTLNRVCNADKRVDELTYAQLKEYKLFDTEETVPLLTEVLELVHKRVPIIVELKTGTQNEDLCRLSSAIILEYKGAICIESFNPAIVSWFRSHHKEIFRGQLAAGAKSFRSLPKLQAFMLSNLLTNGIARPHFIAYRANEKTSMAKLVHKIGAIMVVWTIDDTMDAAMFEADNDCVIFQYYLPAPRYKEPDTLIPVNTDAGATSDEEGDGTTVLPDGSVISADAAQYFE